MIRLKVSMLLCLAWSSLGICQDVEVDRHVAALKAGKPAEKVKAAESLRAMGDKAKPALRSLCQAATDKNQNVVQAALEAIEKVGPPLYKPATSLILDQKADGHYELIQAIIKLDTEAEPLIPVLLAHLQRSAESLRDGSPASVQRMAVVSNDIYALAAVGPKDRDVLKTLLAYAKPLDPKGSGVLLEAARMAQRQAAEGLGGVAKNHPAELKQIVSALLAIAQDEKNRNRATAIGSLGKIGPDAKDALPALKKMKLDKEELIRGAAGAAVDKIEKQ